MKQFNYIPKNGILSYLWAFLVPAAMIIVPIVSPFGIRVGQLVILPYPYSTIVVVIIGICLLTYQYLRFKREKALKQNARPITVDNDKITFVKTKGGKIEEVTFSLNEVTGVDFDKEDEILEVSTGKGKYKFDADFFDTKQHFEEFKQLFYKK